MFGKISKTKSFRKSARNKKSSAQKTRHSCFSNKKINVICKQGNPYSGRVNAVIDCVFMLLLAARQKTGWLLLSCYENFNQNNERMQMSESLTENL